MPPKDEEKHILARFAKYNSQLSPAQLAQKRAEWSAEIDPLMAYSCLYNGGKISFEDFVPEKECLRLTKVLIETQTDIILYDRLYLSHGVLIFPIDKTEVKKV